MTATTRTDLVVARAPRGLATMPAPRAPRSNEVAGAARVLAFGRADETAAREQIARVERWARRDGYQIIRVSTGVPSLGRMLSACRRGRVDIVGVTDLSRLATCPGVLVAVLSLLAHAGVRVAVVHEEAAAEVHAPWSSEFLRGDLVAGALDQLALEERPTPRRLDARWRPGRATPHGHRSRKAT